MRIKRFAILTALLMSVFNLDAQSVIDSDDMTTFYVSSSVGKDTNDGLSEATPKATISSIASKKNVRIRLKCGDVFYERMFGYRGSIIENYGKGARPVLCGFKVLKNHNAWVSEGDNIWSLDLSVESNFYGYLKSRSSNKATVNNVGLIYQIENDKVFGHLVKSKELMHENGDFYTSDQHVLSHFEKQPFSKLYCFTQDNPRQMGEIAFSMYDPGISSMNNCTIRNIAVVGFSMHGIMNCSNCIIDNCQIDLIGGAIFVRDREPWCRYGNGVEISTANVNINVKNCLISRTYDCATTIQGNPGVKVVVKNIHFKNNRIYHCRQAFEHFIDAHKEDLGSSYEDCSFEGNICYEMGENEFSSPEARDACILSYENAPKNIAIRNNVFFGGAYYCSYTYSKGLSDNTVYIYDDQYINHYHGIRNFHTLYASSISDIKAFRDKSSDSSVIKVIKRNSIKSWWIGRKILKRVKWNPTKF